MATNKVFKPMKMTNWTAEKSTNKRLKSRSRRQRYRAVKLEKRRAHYKILILYIVEKYMYVYICIWVMSAWYVAHECVQ